MLKLPPQNIEAEESILGSLMIDKEAIFKVGDILHQRDFYKPVNAKIFEVIIKLYEKHEPIDILSVTSKLKEEGFLEEVGGTNYLTKLIENVPTAAHIAHYAKLVKEKKILRDLIHTSAEIGEEAFNPSDDVESLLDSIEQKIFSISQHSLTKQFIGIKDGLHAAYERIEKLHSGEGKLRGVSTGFSQLDNYLSGLQKSDLIILGARPSVGKTAFALDIARHVAVKEGRPIGLFSLEMSREQVIDRLIAAESHVPLWKLRTGRLNSDTDFEMIQTGLDILSRAPIFIEDSPSPNILQIRSMARRLQSEHGLELLVIDYLQLIQPRTNNDNIVQQITEISRSLKGVARELNIPVLALAQLSRAVEQRESKIPRLSDLRDSGSLEQDSDVVMFIYRADREKSNPTPEEQNTTEIIIAKHRNGPLGTVKLKFDSEKVSFRNIDSSYA